MDINLVNNGKPYFFRLDIAKENGSMARISDYLKTRVSDNGKKVPVKWFDQGQEMNVHGFSPFIQGGVGKWIKDDETNGLVPSSDVVYRDWQGTPADVTDDGMVYYTLEDQFFCKQGEFVGVFGLRDNNGNIYTSVNIVFSILGNDLRIFQTKEYYIDELENLKRKFENDGNQAVQDFNAKIEAGTETDRQALDALRASIQANRDGQASIAEQQASIIRQIKDNDIVTIAEQQADINEISQAINNRLSQLHNGPVAIENAELLKSKYPKGSDGTFLTLDTNHIWIWLNNQWTDAGTYQAAGLSQQAQQAIENTRSIVLGNELISNGSFGTGQTDPAIPWTGDTHLAVQKWSDRNWLQISSDGNLPFKGVQWNLNDSNKTYFDNPLQLDFDIRSLENKNLEIYVIYYDESGARLTAQHIDYLNLTAGKYTHYQNVIYLDQSQRSCAYVALQILQNSTDTIRQIIITGVSLHEIYYAKTPSSNLLALDNAQPNYPEITSLSTDVTNNKRWLTIKSTGGKAWAGAYWDIPVVQDMPYDPFKLEFDLRGDNLARTWNIAIKGWDNAGKQSFSINVDDIYVDANQIVHISHNILFPQQVSNCAKLQLSITTSDTNPLSYTRISDLSLTLVPKTVNTGNNLLNLLFAHINKPEITSLSTDVTNNKQWLTIKSTGGKAWAGACWDIPVVQDMPYDPFKLEFDLRGDNLARTWNIAIKGWDNAGKQSFSINVDDIYVDANQIVHISHNILFPQQVSNCAKLQLSITTSDTNPLSYTRISDLSLTLVPKTISNGITSVNYGLPIMDVKGDLTAMTKDNATNITWTFIETHQTLNGYGTLKWQGNSSLNFEKKSYRLKTLTSDYQQKDKVKFKASWKKASKFNLKAYYTDGLLSRDPVNSEIGGAIASSRGDLPNDLVEEDNFGLIQGFPIILTLNGEYAGLYSLNTTRPDFDYTKFAIMGNQANKLTTFQETNPSVKLDGTDFESLNPEDAPTDEEKQAVNTLINFISTSSDDDFKTKLADHISLNSAIDYLIFNNVIGNRDAFAKNQIYLSWDGTHWYLQAYDLDDSYQAGWDGNVFEAPTDIIGTENKLFARLNTLFSSQIKNRYQEIRTWLTPDYVLNKYKNRIDKIGVQNYQREFEKWNNPAKNTEDFAQLRKAVYTQFRLLDSKWLE